MTSGDETTAALERNVRLIPFHQALTRALVWLPIMVLFHGDLTDLPTSTESWTDTLELLGGSPTKQSISITFTPQVAGPWQAVIGLIKETTDPVYICPKAVIS